VRDLSSVSFNLVPLSIFGFSPKPMQKKRKRNTVLYVVVISHSGFVISWRGE